MIFFLSLMLLFAGASCWLLNEKSAAWTFIGPCGPDTPNLKSDSSSICMARLTDSGRKYTIKASPLNLPFSSIYILIRGRPLSISSAITPHLEKTSRISSNSASRGIDVTKTAVFTRCFFGFWPLFCDLSSVGHFAKITNCKAISLASLTSSPLVCCFRFFLNCCAVTCSFSSTP
jgi:hypothetical protein